MVDPKRLSFLESGLVLWTYYGLRFMVLLVTIEGFWRASLLLCRLYPSHNKVLRAISDTKLTHDLALH